MAVDAPTFSWCPIYWTYFDKFLLTVLIISPILNLEHSFVLWFAKGVYAVSEHELKLIELLRENDNPEIALLLAVKVFAAFLAMSQEPLEHILAALLESA